MSKNYLVNIINQMEKAIILFYPKFKKSLTYKGYFLSYKVLPNEKSAKRSKSYFSFFS